MENSTYYEPTKDETTSAGRAMIAAALAELGERVEDSIEYDLSAEVARRVVKAMAQAEKTLRAEQARLASEKGTKYARIHVSPASATATAFWLWSQESSNDVSDMPPCSVVGETLLGLARGFCAVTQMEAVMTMVDGEELFTEYNSATCLEEGIYTSNARRN